jgi:aspartate aminotransferase-like enzyme
MMAEGLENRYERHRKMAERTREWVLSKGFGLFAAEGARSMTLTAASNDGKTDLEKLKKLAGEKGYAIDNGYGKIKNKTFRIAHMADFTLADLEELFGILVELLPAARGLGRSEEGSTGKSVSRIEPSARMILRIRSSGGGGLRSVALSTSTRFSR